MCPDKLYEKKKNVSYLIYMTTILPCHTTVKSGFHLQNANITLQRQMSRQRYSLYICPPLLPSRIFARQQSYKQHLPLNYLTKFLNTASYANAVSPNIFPIPLLNKGSFFKFSATDVHLLYFYIYLEFFPLPLTHSIFSNTGNLIQKKNIFQSFKDETQE